MKSMVWIPVALLAGLALGGWPAREKARRLEVEVEQLRKEAKSRDRSAGALGQVAQMIRLPDSGPARPPSAPDGGASPAATTATNAPARRGPPLAALRPRPGDERSLRDRIDAGMDAWRVRSDIARDTFVDKAGFDAAQAAQFDVLAQAMNLRIRDRLDLFAEEVRSGAEITPESGAKMIHDLSGIVVMTYSEMDRTLPEWRAADMQRFDMADFIDPSVAEPLVGIEDELRRADRGRRP
jgi:hypothetical protein